MSFLQTTRAKIGEEAYSRLDKAANKEVALAMQMPLLDDNYQKNFYSKRFLVGELLPDCELFERVGLKIFPTDVVDILFRCKLLFAAKTGDEYLRRSSGFGFSFFGGRTSLVNWDERAENFDVLLDRHFSHLREA